MNTTLALVLLALATSVIGVIALGGDWANRNIDEANRGKSRDFLAPKPMPSKPRLKQRPRIGGKK